MEDADPKDSRLGSILVLQGCGHGNGSIVNLLTARGFEVNLVSDIDAALSVLDSMPFELILLDTTISDSNGIALCRHLKANPRTWDLPIIFLTSVVDAGRASEALDTGAVDFVSKPFNPDELAARIETHLELKRTRDDLQQIIREKSELMSTIAHELKNPLTAIQTAGILLRDSGLSGNEPRGELVESILESCSQSLRMINQRMERFSRENRAARTKVEPVDLPDAIHQVVEQNHANALAKGIEMKVSVPDGDAVEVLADYQAVCVVIDNLVSNAIKFSPPGRTVTIAVAAGPDNGMRRISVTDQGPGLTAEDRWNLFKPYHRLSAAPTGGETSHGLGLSIAARLAGSMKGEIGCDSEVGNGATFWVNLPVEPDRVSSGQDVAEVV